MAHRAGARGAQRGRGADTTGGRRQAVLVRQVASPVRWNRTACISLAREGATAWLEVGPAACSRGLLKRTIEGARGHAVEDPESLDNAALASPGHHRVTESKALAGRIAIVTGGTRGNRLAIAARAGGGRRLRGSLWPRRGPARVCRQRDRVCGRGRAGHRRRSIEA